MSPHRLIPLSDAPAWNAALAALPHAPAHTHAYNAALARSVQEPVVLYTYGDSAACPLLLRPWRQHTDITTPYGASGMIGAVPANAWETFARSQGWVCGYLAMHPTLPHPLPEAAPGNTVYTLDLTQPPEALLAAMAPTHRYELRRELRAPVPPVTDRTRIAEALPALYAQTLARTGAGRAYHFSPETLRAWVHTPGFLALAAGGEHIQAVSLFPYTETAADYLLNAATPEGRRFTRGLLWQAVLALQALGVRSLNLGGGAREGDALEAFKRRLGGQAQCIPVLKQVYDAPLFAQLCADAGKAANLAGYFPPYRNP